MWHASTAQERPPSSPASGEGQLTRHGLEREGPAVATPGSVGFGTKLIEQSVKGLGGDVQVEFAATGLSCQISLPLDGG